MRRSARVVGGAALALALAAVLSGCSSSSGSRAELYESIDGLAADSAVIVVGTVKDQHVDDATTVSSVEVVNAPANPQLGAELEGERTAVEIGDLVEVRQDVEPLLSTGGQYLLFLTPSMLPGDASSQYFITGAVAGLYERDGDEFRRVVADSGDTLPDTITITGSEGG
jgi:hypothetical protein